MGLNKIKKNSYIVSSNIENYVYIHFIMNSFYIILFFSWNEMKNCKIIFLNKSAMKSYQHGTV